MPKRRRSNSRRRYSDCAPQAPCISTDESGRSFSGVGPVVSGFDLYGYPIIRNANLPAPFRIENGARQYGAVQSAIKPMKLVATPANGAPPPVKASIAKVSKFKLKPAPTVPAAPDSLPPQFKFCVQKGASGYFFRFRNAKTSLHGAEAEVHSCDPDDTGMMICGVRMPGTSNLTFAPLCEEEGADKEPVPQDCCVRALSGEKAQLVCPGSAYDLLIVKIVTFAEAGGIQIASVEHPDLPGGGVRLPVCEPIDEEPDERPCCIEEETGLIVCPEGMDFALAGKKIPLEFLEFVDNVDGMKVARLRCGDISDIPPSDRAANPALAAMFNICEELGGYVFPVCTRKPPKRLTPRPKKPKRPKLTPRPIPPPPKFPDVCCYDPATGTLVCEGTPYHGLAVQVVAEVVVGGKPIVSVEHPKLPGGGARLPLCPPPPDIPKLPPGECCVVESSAGLTLVCDPASHPWNGKPVTDYGQCIDTPNGRMCVLNFSDEYGTHTLEVPACPPPPVKIPPPTTDDIPPAPDPIPIPIPPGPRLPPPTPRPPGPTEDSECKQKWDEMVSAPAKLNKCDRKWLELLRKLRSGRGRATLGRRASGLNLTGKKPRKYGMGIDPDHLKYARFPGLRGGRRTI